MVENQVKNCISEELSSILKELTIDQIRWIVARQECSSDSEAAKAVGLSPRTIYNWTQNVPQVKRAAALMSRDGFIVAKEIRKRNLTKAMMIKAAGLDSRSEKTRQAAATEIIEWEMGKAVQRNENKDEQSSDISITFKYAGIGDSSEETPQREAEAAD